VSRYDITVLTLIDQDGTKKAADQITFFGVGEGVREFIAGSCRVTLGRLLRLPEDKSSVSWNLKYRTVVLDAETKKQISDTKLITFPSMSQQHILEFQRWAIQQLTETVDAIEKDDDGSASVAPNLHKRNKLLTIFKMFMTRRDAP
jgi:hypothetical protein